MRKWFSAGLHLVVHIESVGRVDQMLSVVAFRAADWHSAFERALELGRAMEESYKNSDNQTVDWKLVKVATLDLLGDEIEDGREIYSQLFEMSPSDTDSGPGVYDPENSHPGHSGV